MSTLRADVQINAQSTVATPGNAFPLTLQISNSDELAALDIDTADLIHYTLKTTSGTFHGQLLQRNKRFYGKFSLAPFSFENIQYFLTLPEGLDGNCLLSLDAYPQARLMLTIQNSSPGTNKEQPVFSQPEDKNNHAHSDTVQRYANHFSVYDPVYFVVGLRENLNAKFQLSFKYRLFDDDSSISDSTSPLNDLYFSYTQTAVWDLGEDSAPFRDTSYRPAAFLLHDTAWEILPGLRLESLQWGIEHESNGKDGLSSRSVNRAFITPTFAFDVPAPYYVNFGVKAYEYAFGLEENPDLPRYLGNTDLFLRFGRIDDWQFSLYSRIGKGDRYGNLQVDFTYPLDLLWEDNLDAFLHLQYFNGYGETLQEYNIKRPSQFRLGVMLLR